MSKQYEVAIVIGRMHPVHNGHMHLISEAFKIAHRVLVLLGDTGGPRTIKNPFTIAQREQMILNSCVELGLPAPDVTYVFDSPSDQAWISRVNGRVKVILDHYKLPRKGSVVLVGHNKDNTSRYLDWFPNFAFSEIPYKELGPGESFNIDATKIREFYFTDQLAYAHGSVPQSVFNKLLLLKNTDQIQCLIEEYKDISKYKKSWEVAPYPPTFLTVDAVVIQSGHILLCERGKTPGKGLYCLPGGFVEQKDRLVDSMLRELDEETGINIQKEVLRGRIVAKEIFDDPERSLRGRTVTTAFLIKLDDTKDLPKLKTKCDPDGGVVRSFWLPLNDIGSSNMFEDHFQIIETMLQLLPRL
jgi:bifunctional NMN adenylyltransferase/nudix hydrolase